MVRGFLANGWVVALKDYGCSHPDRAINVLQRMVWDSIVEPLWKVRNDILHRQKNNFDSVEEERMAERLIWYSMHKHEVLDAYDHFLARFEASQIHAMTRTAKREWLRHLDVARAAHAMQRLQKAHKQNSIVQYLQAQPAGDPEPPAREPA